MAARRSAAGRLARRLAAGRLARRSTAGRLAWRSAAGRLAEAAAAAKSGKKHQAFCFVSGVRHLWTSYRTCRSLVCQRATS